MGKGGMALTVKGTRGDDPNLTIPSGASINQVTIDGNSGSDTLNLSNYGSGVTIGLNSGAKSTSYVTPKEFSGLWPNTLLTDDTTVRATIKNVENLVGTNYDDSLSINIQSVPKSIDGGGGDDFLVTTGGGTVLLVGGTGCDWLYSNGQTTAVGGTYAGGVASPDGSADYFICNSAPLILDFEVGTDRLIFELTTGTTIEGLLAGTWVTYGGTGSALMVNGAAEVMLANVGFELAQTIELGFAAWGTGTRVEGSSGDDVLLPYSNPTHFVFGADSGDDVAGMFDILTDVLVFEDGVIPTWSDTLVNGAPALLGTWADGSVTIQGLGTDDLPSLSIQGVTDDPVLGAAGPGPWSTDSDYPMQAASNGGGADMELAAVALMAG